MKKSDSPRENLVQATLRLLRTSGLSGASLNRALEDSGAPKGSLYHYFPGGKEELVIAALQRFSDQFSALLETHWLTGGPFPERWQALLSVIGGALARSDFTLGCPVAATALDLEKGDKEVRRVLDQILSGWTDVIARGLPEVAESSRRGFAESLLAIVEGALLLARTRRSLEPLRSAQRFGLDAYAQARR